MNSLQTPSSMTTTWKKSPKKRSSMVVTAYTGNSKYAVVRSCLQQAGIQIVDEEEEIVHDHCVLLWMDSGVLMETVMQLEPWQTINHFPGMHEICRKDNLTRNLNKMRKLFPKREFNFYPKAWWLPTDFMEFMHHAKSYAKRKSVMFIAKPDSSSQGRGIFLFKNPQHSQIQPLIHAGTSDMIIQKYLTKPFLIDGLKFDFRVYVLVASCDPLRVFVYKEGLARFATHPYEVPTEKNTENVFMHLTNYAINKKNQKFDKSSEKGSKRSLMSVLQELKQQGHPVDAMWTSMKDAIVKTLLVVQPYLSRVYESSASRSTATSTSSGLNPTKSSSRMAGDSIRQKSQCFELLGFDIILDNKFKPWVLEVNHSPSLTCDADIDLEVKQALLRDTLELLGFSNHEEGSQSFLAYRKQVLEGDKKETARRLFQSNGMASADGGSEKLTVAAISTSCPTQEIKLTQESWEDAHMGSFERLYPVTDPEQTARYDNYLRVSKQLMALDQKETNSTKGRKAFIQKQQQQRELDSMKFSSFLKRTKSLTAVREKDKVRQSSVASDTEKSGARSKPPTGTVTKPKDTSLKKIYLGSQVKDSRVHYRDEARTPSTTEALLLASLPEAKRFPTLTRITPRGTTATPAVERKSSDSLLCVGRGSSEMSPVSGRVTSLARSRTSLQPSTFTFPSPFPARKTLPSLNSNQITNTTVQSRYSLESREKIHQLASSENAEYQTFAKSMQVIERQLSQLKQ